MNRGRPRIFVTLAEKQKAYRERKKQAEALRNSSGNILEESQPVDSDLIRLWNIVAGFSAQHDQLRHMQFYGPEWEAFGGYNEWNRQINMAYNQWHEAHEQWANEWDRQGRPCGPWCEHQERR